MARRETKRRHLGALALLMAAGCGNEVVDGTGGSGGGGVVASTGLSSATGATTTSATVVASSAQASTGGDGDGDGGDEGDEGGGGSAPAGSGGEGGTAPCIELTIDPTGHIEGLFDVGFLFTPALGADREDAFGLSYAAESGSFDLASDENDDFASCEQCVTAWEDTIGTIELTSRIYFQTGGTIDVTEAPSGFPAATVGLTDVRLVEVSLDEDLVATPVPGGICLTVVDTELTIIPDGEWECDPSYYGTFDGCDCGCGIPDPDCEDATTVIYNCGPEHDPSSQLATCGVFGTCVAPADWTCGEDAFRDGDTCDCDCGAPDLDCTAQPRLPIEGCDDPDATCAHATCLSAPPGWTCAPGYYGALDGCDCECGVYDPDCDEDGPIYNCGPNQLCTQDAECDIPTTWACGDETFDDGEICNCQCGGFDPDCNLGAPIVGCDADEVCIEDECTPAVESDRCIDATPLTEGTVTGSWVGTSNDIDPGDDGCTGYAEVGGDVFYTVSLLAGETLRVEIDQAGSGADSALYLVTDCADGDSCVAGIDLAPNLDEALVYTAPTDVDLYLVVDQYEDTNQVDFTLFVEIE